MRALVIATFFLAGCSFAVDTDNLSGGVRADAQVETSPGTDSGGGGDSGGDTGTCNPEDCTEEARVVQLASIAPCTSETVDKVACRQKLSETCRAANPCCFKGAYGPVAFPNAAEATILCFIGATYPLPVSEIVASAPGCTATALASRACDNAVYASAKKRGKAGAILQTVASDSATAVELEFVDEVNDVTWAQLTALDPGCTMANAEKQACTNAVQRFCTTGDLFEGYLGGIGPLRWTASAVTVACF